MQNCSSKIKKKDTRYKRQTIINILNKIIFKHYSLIIIICLYLVSWLLFILPAFGLDASSIGGGARSLGMGRTGIASPGRLDNLFLNPANLAELETAELTCMQTKIAEDVNYNFLSYGIPVKGGKLGVGLYLSGVDGIKTTAADLAGRFYSTGSFNYNNNLLILSYARTPSQNLSLGGGLKLFSQSMGNQGSAYGFDLDAGLIYKPKENLTLGFSVQNLLPYPISNLHWSNGTQEDILCGFKGGLLLTPRPNLNIAVDVLVPPDTPISLRAGGEYQFHSNLFLRGGLENFTNYTLGIGLIYSNFKFDYAYYIDNVLSNNSTNYFSLSYSFPLPTVKTPEKIPAPSKKIPAKQTKKK